MIRHVSERMPVRHGMKQVVPAVLIVRKMNNVVQAFAEKPSVQNPVQNGMRRHVHAFPVRMEDAVTVRELVVMSVRLLNNVWHKKSV